MAAVLRPERTDDAGFLTRLFSDEAGAVLRAGGLPEDAVAVLVAAQLRARDAGYRAHFPEARSGVIQCGGVRVGRLVEADDGDVTHVVDLAIDPSHRRHGIAAAVLRGAMARWAVTGRVGRADVFVNNGPSLALFAALGFRGTPEDGAAQVRLLWRP